MLITFYQPRKRSSKVSIITFFSFTLQEVNVTGSSKVTDQGVINLLGTLQNENPCASSLRFAKMKATKVRVNGVRHLLNIAKNLQGIRCSNFDVLQVCNENLILFHN